MDRPPDKKLLPMIGRAKTVIVMETGDNPVGIVSEIIVQGSSDNGADRLVYKGPVRFKTATKQHLTEIVLPVADKISESLKVPLGRYEISVKNLGATASAGIGVEIAGFSADLPILLAFLSTSLQVGIRQDVVSTGHVASSDGDLAPVQSIPAKLDAAIRTPGVTAFIFPELDADESMQLFTPVEYQFTKENIVFRKGDINIHLVKNIYDAIRLCFTDESIVFGSLRAGFFRSNSTVSFPQGHIGKAAERLAVGNEKRFWDTLSACVLEGFAEKARLYLQNFVEFHIRNQIYPENFGEKLFHLVLSLPPTIRRTGNLFPLLPMTHCISLSQFAEERIQADVRKLYKASFNEGIGDRPISVDESRRDQSVGDENEKELFERLLAEISQENLTEKIGQPLDTARSSYVTDAVTIKDGFEFNEAVTAFYAHIFRHTGSVVGEGDKAALSTNAIDLANKAFEHKGGYKAALSEGKHGINGGMRIVFDAMTERFKQAEREKYVDMVFKDTIDSLDWDTQVRLMKVFKKHIDPYLPDDLRALSAKQLATDWETILKYFSKSMDNVLEIMKRL